MRPIHAFYHFIRPRALRERARCALAFAGTAALAAFAAGCSMSLPIGALKDDAEVTGSIPGKVATLSSKLSDEDWRRAQAALGVAVDPQGNGAPVSWDNPETGKKGSFVAAGPLYILDNKACRSFIATIDLPGGAGSDQKIQGASCRNGPNDWTVKEAKPWKG